MRIAAPPTTDPCFYGIDTPDKDKLLASRYDVADMAKFIGVDSLAFISIDGLYRAMGLPGGAIAAAAGVLRRLLHRRLSDRARRRRSASRIASSPSSPKPPEFTVMTEAPLGRLAGRVALITGASRGLGPRPRRSPSPQRARTACWSPAPWAGSKQVDDKIKAMGGPATLVPLDVTDGPGIDRLGAALYERFGRLDVLLGNAGILGALSPIGHIEPKIFEQVMAVNVTANWRLIRSIDPAAARAPTPDAPSS